MDQRLVDQLSVEAETAKVAFGSDEYFSARFAKNDQRYTAWTVFALKSLVENIPLTVSDPGVARLKLAWWSNQGQDKFAHPLFRIAQALPVDCEQLNISLQELSNSLDRLCLRQPFESALEKDSWIESAYQGIYKLLAGDCATDSAIALCGPVENARSLLRFKEELDLEIIRVPADVLHRAKLDISALFADPNHELARNLIQAELSLAEKKLGEVILRFHDSPSPALTYALLTRKQLEETLRDGANLLRRKIELTPLRKLWIAWRNK